MKILDKYILNTYLKTFISVFLILMLIFVLQTIWLFIKELAGKDLDLIIILKFLVYYSPKLIPLVLPLTILLASIMVFGNFAENYEFAAMKSTGISLQRAMAGLGVFIVTLGITTFFFSNNVIPWGEYNSYNLRKNIAKLKPAMVIVPGQFNVIGDYNIKVAEKSGEQGQFLKEVVIHKETGKRTGNYTTIISKNGELIGSKDSNVLQLILFDGYFYDDTPPKKVKDRNKLPMTRSSFNKYTINVDLSELNVDLDEKNISDKYTMLNMRDLNYTIDSLIVKQKDNYIEFSENLYNRTNISQLNIGLETQKDSLFTGQIFDLFNAQKSVQLVDLALNTVNSTKQMLSSKQQKLKDKQIDINKHVMAFHDKIVLGFACIILFFVGAPLGALIRKGGLGLPMVIAIILFLTYHFLGIFAKNSAKDGTINPMLGSWISTLVMLPLGIFLTRRATADRGLFEFDHIIQPIKKVLKIKSKDETDNSSENLIDPKDFDKIQNIHTQYKFHANTALIFYKTGLVFCLLYFIFKNNELPNFAEASVQLSVISFIVLTVYYIKTFININALYKLIKERTNSKNILTLLIGLPFYPLTYYIRRNKINEDLTDSLK